MGFEISVLVFSAAIWVTFSATCSLLQRYVPSQLTPLAAIALLVVLSMGCFWLTFYFPVLGFLLNYSFWTAVLLSLIYIGRERKTIALTPEAALWALATAGLLIWAFAPLNGGNTITIAKSLWTHPLPMDNELPLILGRHLLAGAVPTPMVDDWLSSDRPPLQTGFFLLTAPFWMADTYSYQIASTAAQMLIVPAAYSLVFQFTGSRKVSILASAILFFTPFVALNGIFVWPKLLAASFLLSAAAIHFSPSYFELKHSPVAGVLVGILSSGAMLSHGASAFAIIAFGLSAIGFGRTGSSKYTTAAIVSAVALYLPWMSYQKFIDPPGDRLLKWHLAGVVDPSDQRSTLEAMSDQYSTLSASEIGNRQILKMQLAASAPFGFYDLTKSGNSLRVQMFFHFIPSLGAIGILVPLSLLIALSFRKFRLLSCSVISAFLVWVLLLYDVGGAIVHVSSYYIGAGGVLILALLLQKRISLLVLLLVLQATMTLIYYPMFSAT